MKLLRLLVLATVVLRQLLCMENELPLKYQMVIHNFIANLNALDYDAMSSAFIVKPTDNQLGPLAHEREQTGPYITVYENALLGAVGPVQVGYTSDYVGPVVSVHIKVVGKDEWSGVLSVELAETEQGILISSLHIEKSSSNGL